MTTVPPCPIGNSELYNPFNEQKQKREKTERERERGRASTEKLEERVDRGAISGREAERASKSTGRFSESLAEKERQREKERRRHGERRGGGGGKRIEHPM